MPALTPKLRLPYPVAGDGTAGHEQLRALAESIDGVLGGKWTPFSAVVTAGSFSWSADAQWKQVGKTVYYCGVYVWEGYNAQSDTITISFPVTPLGSRTVGVGYISGNSDNDPYEAHTYDMSAVAIQSGSVFVMKVSAATSVSGTYPFPSEFSPGDQLAWDFVYEVA